MAKAESCGSKQEASLWEGQVLWGGGPVRAVSRCTSEKCQEGARERTYQ